MRKRMLIASIVIQLAAASVAAAADQVYFAAKDNITDVLVQKISAETVRIDISCWYLTEHAISIALINKFMAGDQDLFSAAKLKNSLGPTSEEPRPDHDGTVNNPTPDA